MQIEVKDVVNEVVYGDGPYISALPVLIICSLRDRFFRVLDRLFKF